MKDLKFRVWVPAEKKMYYRGYHKLLGVLVCDDDLGENEGNGLPVKEIRYEDGEMLQGTNILDKNGVEIFEGDRVRVIWNGKELVGDVGDIPDMHKSRGLHPMQELLVGLEIPEESFSDLEFEILGNIFEAA